MTAPTKVRFWPKADFQVNSTPRSRTCVWDLMALSRRRETDALPKRHPRTLVMAIPVPAADHALVCEHPYPISAHYLVGCFCEIVVPFYSCRRTVSAFMRHGRTVPTTVSYSREIRWM